MTLEGKGFFIDVLSECEEGNPASILAATQAAGLSHVVVKIADQGEPVGVDDSGIDITAPIVRTLRSFGLAVWGWHSVKGSNPPAEADIAIQRTQALGLDGYVVVIGNEYQSPGMAESARQFMAELRGALKIPFALSSFRFPAYHPALPWSTFLEFCDLHMPRVTWENGHDAGAQLRESKRQCDALPNARPLIPTGAAYSTSGWLPTVDEIHDFLNTAIALKLTAVNFQSWDACRQKLPPIWETVAGFAWPGPTRAPFSPLDAFLTEYLVALNSHQPEKAGSLYDPAANQVWADKVRSSASDIQAGFADLFNNISASTIFTICQARAEDDSRKFSWKAGLFNGETTLVLENGKIILEYTYIA
jgi:hypothetical protein